MRFGPKTLGRLGEQRAAWFYRLRGYAVVARNVRLAAGEIDLVVRRGRTVAIVEVKTRQSRRAGHGHEAVHRDKRERMIRLAEQYAARDTRSQIRFDVLSLYWNGWRFVITQYRDAFQPVADARRPWQWRG